jgi:glycosyltransferase involved in cell wall biosynthesis
VHLGLANRRASHSPTGSAVRLIGTGHPKKYSNLPKVTEFMSKKKRSRFFLIKKVQRHRKLQTELVSVIIPAFNAAEYIRQSLNSVLAQTYQALEVIVVDDGSADATSAVAEEFVKNDARVQLVRQSNAGVGAARNTAIGRARGKYIAPLDADDVWFPEKLEKQVAVMEKCDNETGLVYCWSTVTDKHGEFVGRFNPQPFEGRLRRFLALRNIIDNASVPLFRAAALEKVGLYLTRTEQGGAQGCEDWDLYMRIAEAFSIRLVPEYLLAYRQTESSMSVNAAGMKASFAVVSRRARQRNCDLASGTFRWSAGYFYLYLVQNCYRSGQYSECLVYLKEAVRSNPLLLLTTGIYRTLMSCVVKLIRGSTGNHLAEQVRPSSEKKEQEAGLNPKKKMGPHFISNKIFANIERRRWSTALHAGT